MSSGHAHHGIDVDLLDQRERRTLSIRMGLALTAAGLLALGAALETWLPAQAELGELVCAIAAVFATVPILRDAWFGLRAPSLHGATDLIVSAAVLAAWAIGDFKTAALVPMVMVLGHVLEDRSLLGSREAIAALSALTRHKARRLASDGSVHEVESTKLVPDDQVEVRAGERIPADALVLEGFSSVDASTITGESVPNEVAAGDLVHAGSLNLSGRIMLRVTQVGEHSTLGRVVALMHEAERAKPPITRVLESHALHYLGLVLMFAAGTWFLTGNLASVMAVLVASCPCALILAAPATSVAAIAVASRHGILVKGPAFLEELAEVDTVVLDKTGTVTLGELRVRGIESQLERDELLRLAGSLGAASTHPISRALAREIAPARRTSLRTVEELAGKGLRGELVEGGQLLLGRAAFLAECGVTLPNLPEHDGPIVGLARDGRFLGWILLADEARAEAREALDDLRALGLTRQILLTGDRRAVAADVAERLGIDAFEAEVLPQRKLERVLEEVQLGRRPMVVGDGVNDALAIRAGAVGIAMGSAGSDIALASSDVVLMSSHLGALGTSVRLARRAKRTIQANVILGISWTLMVIALAAYGVIGALAAAVLHNVGTLAVLANAGRLLRFDERRRIRPAPSAPRPVPSVA